MLLDEVIRRKKKNHRYSLNKFARDIGISPAQLSGVINGKRGISVKTAQEIADRISWTKKENSIFLRLVELHNAKSKIEVNQLNKKLDRLIKNNSLTYPCDNILGLWTATERIGSHKTPPSFWNPKTDSQFLFFEPEGIYKILFSTTSFSASIWGEYNLENGFLETSEEDCFTHGKSPWSRYYPKIAPIHKFDWVDENNFKLLSQSHLLTNNSLPDKEELVTIWSKFSVS